MILQSLSFRKVAALGLTALLIAAGGASPAYAVVVFSDNFDRNATLTPDTNLANGWTAVSVYGASGGRGQASILGNQLEITNNRDLETATTNLARGRTYVYQDASASFSAPYSTTLASNPGVVTWAFNIGASLQQTNLTGFNYAGGGNYGAGVILAALNNNFGDSSSDNAGYAVIWGNSGADNAARPLRLVRFSDGIEGSTFPISGLTVIAAGNSYVNGDFLGVKVTYDPATNNWSLYAASGGPDPTTVNTQLGSTVADGTYTGADLDYFGAFFNYANGANGGFGNIGVFDNFSVTVVPEPSGFVGLFLASATAMAFYRKSRRRQQGCPEVAKS